MAKTAKNPTKKIKKKNTVKSNAKKSKLRYKSFKLQKRITVDSSHIPKGARLTVETFSFLKRNWKLFFKITFVYLLIYVVFIRVASNISLGETRELIDEFYPGTNAFIIDSALTGLVVASSATVGGLNYVVGLFLTIFTSLALIRAIRLTTNDEKSSLRDAYYNGMQPLVPYLLLMLLTIIQLIPFALGGFLYFAVVAGGVVVGLAEQLLFIVIWLTLTVLSAYWISNTILAMYATTIPDMYPLEAHKATSELVQHRRFIIFRRMIFLGVLLFVINIGSILLAVMIRDGLAFYVRDLVAVISLPIAHVYLYKLYRSVL